MNNNQPIHHFSQPLITIVNNPSGSSRDHPIVYRQSLSTVTVFFLVTIFIAVVVLGRFVLVLVVVRGHVGQITLIGQVLNYESFYFWALPRFSI